MTDDLVERLRDRKIVADTYPWLRADDLCGQAADRIEALTAEVERLRGALQGISEFGKRHTGHGYSCHVLADAALAGEQ